MDNENEINVLDELNKGACMGMDAINFILDKVEDKNFKQILKEQYNEYKKISDKICELYPEYSEDTPHETNVVNKAMTWYGIQMKTLKDDTTSKIEGRKLLNHKSTDSDVQLLVQEYVTMQEEAVEKLKKFL